MLRIKKGIQFPNKDNNNLSYKFSKNLTLATEYEFDTKKPKSNLSVWEALYDLNFEILKVYFKTGNPNIFDSAGYSLVGRCIQYQMPRHNALAKYDGKFYEMLLFLLDNGCEVNLENTYRYNTTALHYVLNPMVGWIDYDSKKATNVEFRSDVIEGMSLSRIPSCKIDIVFRRKIEIVKLLLSRGALNLIDFNGLNPVMIASNLAARINVFPGPESEKKYYREISHLLLEHFSLSVRNVFEINLQISSRLNIISVKHGLQNVLKTNELVTMVVQRNVQLSYTFVYELPHQFFISRAKSFEVNDELKTAIQAMQYFDLDSFLLYFRFNSELKGIGKFPLKSCLILTFTSPGFGQIEIFSISTLLLYLYNSSILNWVMPYQVNGNLSKLKGIFSLFQFLINKPDFNVSQIGPFFIEFIARINPNCELASKIQYLLVRYLILLELWILHRPIDESKVYHLKEELIHSDVFTYNTLAHFFLQNFNLFDIIHIKTSFPVQHGELTSVWNKQEELEKQNVCLKSKIHIFMKVLEGLSFQVNNRDETENNTCLHILAKLGREDCMQYLLDYLGAYPFALNSNGINFLDIYEGMNSEKISQKNVNILKSIEKFRHYLSKPYSLRTLSGLVISKWPLQMVQILNPPHNILHFILLHQKPESTQELVELVQKSKRQSRLIRKSLQKQNSKKQTSPSKEKIYFRNLKFPEGETDDDTTEFRVKFNPGII